MTIKVTRCSPPICGSAFYVILRAWFCVWTLPCAEIFLCVANNICVEYHFDFHQMISVLSNFMLSNFLWQIIFCVEQLFWRTVFGLHLEQNMCMLFNVHKSTVSSESRIPWGEHFRYLNGESFSEQSHFLNRNIFWTEAFYARVGSHIMSTKAVWNGRKLVT